MKVLLSAFSCAPGSGSEPNIGWNVAREVAAHHDAWVLTDVANRRRIVAELERMAEPKPTFVFVEPAAPLGRWRSNRWLHRLYYVAWQREAFRVAQKLHKQVGFDIVHHVTFVNSWLPTWMGYLGIPFVWSAGGRDRTPWAFLGGMSWEQRIGEATRNVLLSVLGRLANVIAGRRASLILTSSDPGQWPPGLPVIRMAIGGLDAGDLRALSAIPPRTEPPFRLLSVGRLLGLKGFHLGIEAFARLHAERPESEYWIIGDGPERKALKVLALRLGCASAIRFWGALPREETLKRLAEVDVLVHPSLHEQFGYVLLEAMAAGRPVVCLDVGGPALIVRNGGITIPVRSPDLVVAELYVAMARLALDSSFRTQLGSAARERAKQTFSWEVVGQCIAQLYESMLPITTEPVMVHPREAFRLPD